MPWSNRRLALAVSLLALATLGTVASGQIMRRIGPVIRPGPEAPTAGKDDFGDNSGINLPRDNKLKQQVEAAMDYIKTEEWVRATELLQKLVSIKEDVFAQLERKSPDGKANVAWTSVRDEANRLLAALPPKGREFYQLTYGPEAARLLKEAKATGKPELLAQVMRFYLQTDAGAEATDLLGTYHLDRGNYSPASRCYSLLLARAGADKIAPVVLFKAAYAFHQTGAAEDKANEEQVWKQLASRTRDVRLGSEETTDVPALQNYVASLVRANAERDARDWPLYRGNESRSAQGIGSYAFMEQRWAQPLVYGPAEGGKGAKDTQAWLADAENQLLQKKQPVLPSFFPVTATVTKRIDATGQTEKVPLAIFRTHYGVHAVNVKNGKLAWANPSAWSMQVMAGKSDKGESQAVNNWKQFYLNMGGQNGFPIGTRPNVFFENSTIGTLSTDANNVYAVDDLELPPPPFLNNGMDWAGRGGMQQPGVSAEVSDAIQHNRLQAYGLASGKLQWETGGGGSGPLSGCYFLGPPLPLGGKLYVLTEKQQELRLICLDPTPTNDREPRVVSVQTLATTREKMQSDVSRRVNAAHLTYAEGVLVCPTNAGAVLGVDLLFNSLLWAYPYRDKTDADDMPPAAFGGRPRPGWVMMPDGRWHNPNADQNQWKTSPPVIVDGKVVFTAPDSKAIHCLNLRDGLPLWKLPRTEDDQYFAGVYAGKVLIVGRKSVRALGLTRGEPLWTVETGLPSGQGVASGNIYYLPLKEAGQAKTPEICAIDLEHGQVVAHTKSRPLQDISKGFQVPGNLVFYEGDVISQTAHEIVAFPQLKVKLAEIDQRIARDPRDPVGLTERGVLRLDEGNLQGAIDDLSLALDNKPDVDTEARARGKLFETLTQLFQNDFNKAEPFLARYESMCKVDLASAKTDAERAERITEERRRRANFLCLLAKGREKQRRLVEAFEKYQEFAALAAGQEMVTVIDEPSVRAAPDVWSQGRIAAMVSSAKPEERQPLEDRLRLRWEEVRAKNDIEELKKFVAVFGSLFAVGKEARLLLAERLIDDPDPKSLIEAERHLSLLRGPNEEPAIAARAVECLARLCTSKGMLEDAAYFYTLLGQRYPNDRVRQAQTGADLYQELEADKRFLPLLGNTGTGAMTGKVKAIEERGSFANNNPVFLFEHAGEPLPFFHNHRVALQQNMHKFKLLDRSGTDAKWEKRLTETQFAVLATSHINGYPSGLRFNYQTLGHLIVLPVGHMVFGIDPVGKQVLWEQSLTSTHPNPNQQPPQLVADPRDGGVEIVYSDGWKQRLGQAGPLSGTSLCLQTRDGLVAIDPVTGRMVWSRSDVSPLAHLFGDGDLLFVVEMTREGVPSGTKALRASDGVTVPVADFTALYAKRHRVLGRQILLAENEDKGGGFTMRLHDVAAGKDVWKEKYQANSLVLQSEDPRYGGVVEPDGSVHVRDLLLNKKAFDGKFERKEHLDKVQTVHLLKDASSFYVTCSVPIDPAIMPFGPPMSLLQPGAGLRSMSVNGALYCFRADTGQMRWWKLAPNQTLLLDQFADIPVLILGARYNRWAAGPVRNVIQAASMMVLEKETGKLVYENDNLPNNTFFYGLHLDARGARLDFVGYQFKISFFPKDAVPVKVGRATEEENPDVAVDAMRALRMQQRAEARMLRMRLREAAQMALTPQ